MDMMCIFQGISFLHHLSLSRENSVNCSSETRITFKHQTGTLFKPHSELCLKIICSDNRIQMKIYYVLLIIKITWLIVSWKWLPFNTQKSVILWMIMTQRCSLFSVNRTYCLYRWQITITIFIYSYICT